MLKSARRWEMGFVLFSLNILVNHPLCFHALLYVVISFVCLVLSCYKLFVISISMQLVLSIESSHFVVALVAIACSFQLQDFRNCSFVAV